MYANNGKISNRQLFRLYVFDLMGISTLLIPPFLAKLSGIDGVFAILIGGLMGLGYLLYLGLILKKMNMNMEDYLEQGISKWTQKISVCFLFIHGILTGGFIAYVFANLMQYSLVREVPYVLLLLVTILVAAYSVSGGVENRARIYEVLFWIILIPYVIMMFMGLKDVEPMYINHFFESSPEDIVKSSYLVFLFLTPLFFTLFLVDKTEYKMNRKKEVSAGSEKYGFYGIKTVAAAVSVATVILLGSYMILLGNFGGKALQTMKFPVITLMSTVQLRGSFLKRMDALMLAVWFFTLLALLNLHIHFGVKGLKKLIPKLTKWSIIAVTVAVFGVAWILKNSRIGVDIFLNYYGYAALPIMIIGPGLLLFTGKKEEKNKKQSKSMQQLTVLLICSLAGNLWGCQATQLENRCFPMMVAIDYDTERNQILYYESFPDTQTDSKDGQSIDEIKTPMASGQDFAESKAHFEKALSKVPDYNHLKVIVIGESILKNEEAYHDIIKFLGQSEIFPRNTYVCVTENVTDMITVKDSLPQEIGTYIEEYLENHEAQQISILSLGDLIDEASNGEMTLYAPYLKVEKEYIEWENNYEIKK